MADGDRFEASWVHSRKQRKQVLLDIRAKVDEMLALPAVEDRAAAVVFVAVVAAERGAKEQRPLVIQGGTAYGLPAVGLLVQAVEEALTHMAQAVKDGMDARKKARIRGKRTLKLVKGEEHGEQG